MRRPTCILLLLLIAAPSFGAQADDAAPARVADLAWLAGCWLDDGAERRTEECWLAPRGGLMLGLHREVTAGQRSWFEFLRLAEVDGQVTYLASPGGREPTPFVLVERGEKRAVFANPEHDFPQRILYWIDDDGALHARTEGDVDGAARAVEWVWQPAPFPLR